MIKGWPLNRNPNLENTYMSKLQSYLDLANRMINAGIDQIAVGEILIEQLKNEIDNLKVEAFDLLPIVQVDFSIEK